MREEVQSCGRANEVFSFTLFGLSENAVVEGAAVYKEMHHILKDVIYDNIMLKQAMQGQVVKLRPATANIGSVLPTNTLNPPKGGNPLFGDDQESALVKQIEAGATVWASERAAHATMLGEPR